jgi:hypothetical protein
MPPAAVNTEHPDAVAEHVLAWRGVAWRGVAWRGVAWRGVAWRRRTARLHVGPARRWTADSFSADSLWPTDRSVARQHNR